MRDTDFEQHMKIGYLRAITDLMFERGLIDQAELKQIYERLDQMKLDLISAKPRETAPGRKLTAI